MRSFSIKVIALYILISQVQTSTSNCQFATPRKYIGYFSYKEGYAKINPIYSIYGISSRDKCNEICKLNDTCYATMYNNGKCFFYNTANFTVSNGYDQYTKWLPCNMSSGTQPPDGRCVGRWVTYDDIYLRVNEYDFLLTITGTQSDCENKCLDNPLCGSVNYNDYQCIFVPKWPYSNFNYTKRPGWKLSNWTCVDNFIQNLSLKKHIYQPIPEKRTGYWSISHRNYTLKNDDSTWLNFHTQSYTDCLKECDLYSHCSRVFYNVTYSMCVLDQIEFSNKIAYPHMEAIVFQWNPVKNDSHNSPINEEEKRYLGMNMTCIRINDTKHLFISKDDCGKCPPKYNFTLCSRSNDRYNWNIKDSCFVNQSYWAFASEIRAINESGIIKLWSFRKIFTGLQTYWLAYLDKMSLVETDYLECRIFNAAQPKNKMSSKDIISRLDYHAMNPRGNFIKYRIPPIQIDISTSQRPFHSCKTIQACTDVLRRLQVLYFTGEGITGKFYDIPFNFMIDEDGHIYECRGWENECAAVGNEYNKQTMCIAYIGWFSRKMPSTKSLNSVKKLIQYAVDKGFVSKDYKLFIQQDLAHSFVDYNLKIVLKNWYRYRGFIPENCANISIAVLILNFSLFICVSFVFWLFFYKTFNWRKSCSNCRFLQDKSLNFQQLIPMESDYVVDDNEQYNDSNDNIIIYPRATVICNRNHVDIVKYVKIWFWNKYLNSINKLLSGTTFMQYLKSFPNRDIIGVIMETSMLIDDGFEKRCAKIVICTPDMNGMKMFKNLVKNERCICKDFVVEHLYLTSAYFDGE